MNEIIAHIIWIAFASIHGAYDAELYAVRNHQKAFKADPHDWASAMRVIVAMGLIYGYMGISWMLPVHLLAYGLIFSFWHNGFYFERRKRIDAPKGYWFFGKSTTSEAKLEFSAPSRIIQFIVGVIILLVT